MYKVILKVEDYVEVNGAYESVVAKEVFTFPTLDDMSIFINSLVEYSASRIDITIERMEGTK